MARQVRLDEAVADALVEEFGPGSLSAAANWALRDRYGMPGALVPAEPPERPSEPLPPGSRPASPPRAIRQPGGRRRPVLGPLGGVVGRHR